MIDEVPVPLPVIETEHLSGLSYGQLCDQYRFMELRKRYWQQEIKGSSTDRIPIERVKHLAEQMSATWAELERRTEHKLPAPFVLSLINNNYPFSINLT